MKSTEFYVYIMTNKDHGTLYVGFTDDIYRRAKEHKDKVYPHSFTARYNLDKLVFYTTFQTADEAYEYEKRIKRWKRQYKFDLIEESNKNWRDLFNDFIEEN